MAATDSTHVINCPSCNARFAVAASMAGKRARCAGCGTQFTVSAPSPSPAPPARKGPGDPMPAIPKSFEDPVPPQFISVDCRVCGTRLTGRLEHVGKKLKCPDCGAGTVLPEPPKPKQKNMPAALDGEQYELWDPDEQPLPSELIAAQPKYIAIECKTCGSLMHALDSLVGENLACPDCGTLNVVPPPGKVVVRQSVLSADKYTPQVDLDSVLNAKPMIIPRTVGLSLAEQEREAEVQRAFEKSQRTGRPFMYDHRGRAVLPRFPLLTSILSFPFSAGCPSRWGALTLGLIGWGFLLLDGIPHWVTWGSGSSGALSAFGGLAETLLGGVFAIVWFAGLASVFVVIANDSAVGADRVEDWPSMTFVHAMSEVLPLALAIILSAAPGCILAQFYAPDALQTALYIGISFLVIFPLTLLSQLAGNSMWEIVDFSVYGAAIRCPFSMLLFYLESACLVVGCIFLSIAAVQVHIYLPLALAPIFVTAMIIYARLLGRLGWRIGEKIVVAVPEEEPRPDGPKNYNPPPLPRTFK